MDTALASRNPFTVLRFHWRLLASIPGRFWVVLAALEIPTLAAPAVDWIKQHQAVRAVVELDGFRAFWLIVAALLVAYQLMKANAAKFDEFMGWASRLTLEAKSLRETLVKMGSDPIQMAAEKLLKYQATESFNAGQAFLLIKARLARGIDIGYFEQVVTQVIGEPFLQGRNRMSLENLYLETGVMQRTPVQHTFSLDLGALAHTVSAKIQALTDGEK